MKSAMAIAAVVAGVIATAAAQDLVIDSMSRDGSMSFWGAQVGTTARVEWAASLTDAGRTNWHGLTDVVVTDDVMTNDIPMFFRVRGYPDTNVVHGLVAYYPFNGNANDASGHGHDGTAMGALPTQDRLGAPNSAFAFDGLSNKIEVAETPGFELNTFTLSIWVNAARFNPLGQPRSDLIAKGSVFQWALQLEASGRVRNAIFTSSGEMTFDSIKTITTNAWYHIAKVWDGETSSTYINGVFDSSMPAGGVLDAGDDPVVMAGMGGALHLKFQGKLDDIRIYNRALSSNEVWRLYNLPY
ncbi:MAG: LamG domain-containing protein [Lentisphaerae bacterium]|nr:LamG domain-containing protein [Lentisphaerota bacterium]